MKKLLLLTIAFIGSVFLSKAAPGDTLWVDSHDETHWSWHGNKFDTVQFPSAGSYQKVIMYYKLGCPQGGCSDWDYTTAILIRDASDTADIKDYEVGRIITPYANGLQHGWYHHYEFDVTDFMPILKDEKIINAFYDGWSDGFTVSIKFAFIEGTPPRTPLSVTTVYQGNYNYGDVNDPLTDQLDEKTYQFDQGAEEYMFRMVATGHGFGGNNNPENCAEFCPKWFNVKLHGTSRFQHTLWNECGLNALYPQPGSWLYNRAGWCPGDEASVFDNELTKHIRNTNATDITLDVDWEAYVGNGKNYRIAAHLFQYGPINHNVDLAIDKILNPSNNDRLSRFNPTCERPKIRIKNVGKSKINSARIYYGVKGGKGYYIDWTGSLRFNETEEIELDIPPHNFFKGDGTNKFEVIIVSANGGKDENSFNDRLTAKFEAPEVLANDKFKVEVKTNNAANENWYIVTNFDGDTVLYRNNLQNNTQYRDTVELAPGCYQFYIHDTEGNGLSYPFNNDGSGSIRLTSLGLVTGGTGFFLKDLQNNFGKAEIFNFSIGYDVTQGADSLADSTWVPQNGGLGNDTAETVSVTPVQQTQSFDVYPNPTHDLFYVTLKGKIGNFRMTLFNEVGQLVKIKDHDFGASIQSHLSVSDLPKGMYYLRIENNKEFYTRPILVE